MDKKEINNKIGQRIKKIREDRKLDIRDVALAINVDNSNLGKIERGERIASTELLVRLSEFYKVHISYFFGELQPVPEDLNKIGVEWISFADKMKKDELTPEEIENIIKAVKKLNI
ncbi:helix-turn-helix domain-containing protein [Fictibacillus aquaticus]|uniref:HTH cro/C1-type domain-containing protein n=1 Tax=Fictibacillus aquaticus TaxID=2021314 RepID=A0A235FBW4_9BACL|nr:helix-turn-helix transcriptional regulator [Fictibacillus aquaticus]OYD58433.1 hypothetical protein CGZ90_00585 [Fictibacillus aquaticus]